jgi:cyclohexanone monooxygenase
MPDLAGRRIGVLGTGSTGIQVITALSRLAGHLTVFQRTPNFSMPCNNQAMDPAYEAECKRHYPEHRHNARVSSGGMEVADYPKVSAMAGAPRSASGATKRRGARGRRPCGCVSRT